MPVATASTGGLVFYVFIDSVSSIATVVLDNVDTGEYSSFYWSKLIFIINFGIYYYYLLLLRCMFFICDRNN